MVTRFDAVRTKEARALQIWQILIGLAHERKTITYIELARMLGFKRAGTMGNFLTPIMCWCARNNLPALTVIVVEKYVGKPGEGLKLKGDVDSERESVYGEDWYAICPPTLEELVDAQMGGRP